MLTVATLVAMLIDISSEGAQYSRDKLDGILFKLFLFIGDNAAFLFLWFWPIIGPFTLSFKLFMVPVISDGCAAESLLAYVNMAPFILNALPAIILYGCMPFFLLLTFNPFLSLLEMPFSFWFWRFAGLSLSLAV